MQMQVVAEGRDPRTTPVGEVMSRSLTVLRSDEKIDDAIKKKEQEILEV